MGFFRKNEQAPPVVLEPGHVVSQQLEDYLAYLKSPLRIMWVNFLAGIFRGLGAILGATVVLAGVLWLLSLIVSFPVIGQFVSEFHQRILGFIEETRYTDNFDRIENLLGDIVGSLNEEPLVREDSVPLTLPVTGPDSEPTPDPTPEQRIVD